MTERDEERLARLNLASYSGTAYRHQSPGFDPRSGTGARRRGGRFNPPRSFQVLYLALSVETAAADLRQAAERMNLPLAAALPREVFVSTVSLDHVLDLRASEALAGLEVTRNQLLAADQARSRVVGEAVNRPGVQALIAPSATGVGDVLALFPENLSAGTIEPRLLATWEAVGDVPGMHQPG